MPTERFDQNIALGALTYVDDIYSLFESAKGGIYNLKDILETFGVPAGIRLRNLFDQIGLKIIKTNPRFSSGVDPQTESKTELDSIVEVILRR